MHIINVGMTRCATTSLHEEFETNSSASTPRKSKEINAFIKGVDSLDAYLKYFPKKSDVYFESSPTYSHLGVEKFKTILDTIYSTLGPDTHIVFSLRNLIERAFSHYWYMISNHHAMYGGVWGVKKFDDGNRFKNLFQEDFITFTNKESRFDFFFPDYVSMINAAINKFGKENVKIFDVKTISSSIKEYINTLDISIDNPSEKSLNVNHSNIPVLFRPSDNNKKIIHNGQEYFLNIPKGSLLIIDNREFDLVKASDGFDIDEIYKASKVWSQQIELANIPKSLIDKVNQRQADFLNIPDSCFLCDKGNLFAKLEVSNTKNSSIKSHKIRNDIFEQLRKRNLIVSEHGSNHSKEDDKFPSELVRVSYAENIKNGLVVVLPSVGKKYLPMFSRHNWKDSFKDRCFLAIADPEIMNWADSNLINGTWFMRESSADSWLPKFAQWLTNFASEQGLDINTIPIVFAGSSLGGYGSLVLASHFKHSFAFSECPQLKLMNYEGAFNFVNEANVDLRSSYLDLNVLFNETGYPNCKILVSLSDIEHLEDHLLPFALTEKYLRSDGSKADISMELFQNEYSPEGHGAVQREVFVKNVVGLLTQSRLLCN